MNVSSWLRHGVHIARTERTRSRRQLDRSSTLRALIILLLVGTVVGSGFSAYTFGAALQRDQIALPISTIQAATTAGFFALLVAFIQQTSRLTERLETDHLLTTVPAREVVLGVVLAASSRIVFRIALAAVSAAVGFGVGAGSLTSVLSIVVSVAGLLALVALLGVTLSFAVELVTTRSPRFRRYKNVFAVVAFLLASIGWAAANAGLVSVDRFIDWFAVAPPAWFVDLGLLGAPAVQSSLLRSVGALGAVVVGIPVLMVATTSFAERVWETEPVSATILHRSRSLVGEGFTERLFAGRVSRPVLTVARKRWLQERRVPRGLMLPGYLIVLLPGVFLPALAAGEVPGISLILLAFICTAATGLAFGMDPVGTEYSSLPMTLTTVSGEQFVRGEILAGVAMGAPVTAVTITVLALVSPLGFLEMLLLALAGVVLCVCSVALAAAIGMNISYRDLLPVPLPLTSATIYGEIGRASFIRMGAMLGLLGFVCLPAFGGYLLAFLAPGATVLGIPTAIVRVGLLVLTTVLAVGVAMVAYRRAVQLYDQYTLS